MDFSCCQIFKYLSSLEVEDFKDVKSGYSITFVSLFLLPYFGLEKTIFEVHVVFGYIKALCIACWYMICTNLQLWGYGLVINFDSYGCQNFRSNPYFEDTKLTKTFTFLDEGTTKVTATSIKWKEGMVRALCSCISLHNLFICCLY